MSNELAPLIEAARTQGKKALKALVEALRADDGAPADVIADLAGRLEKALRVAAAKAAVGRREPAVLTAVATLATDAEEAVRRALVRGLKEHEPWDPPQLLARLLADESSEIRQRAAAVAITRHEHLDLLLATLEKDERWEVREVVAKGLRDWFGPGTFRALLTALARDDDIDVQRCCATALERRLASGTAAPSGDDIPLYGIQFSANRTLHGLGPHRTPKLRDWLWDRLRHQVDLGGLRSFGTLLTERADAGELPRAHAVDAQVEAVIETLTGSAPRAVVLLGESGSGKTSVVHEVVHRLSSHEQGKWWMLRISPAEFLQGTKWLGEWQTKVGRLIELLQAPRKAILYVPNLEELAHIGRSSSGDDNVATMLAPHIEEGRIAILGESTPESFRSGLGAEPSLRRLFTTVQMPQRTPEQTLEIVDAVADEEFVTLEADVRERLLELADLYTVGTAQPGRAVGLLRRLIEHVDDDERPVRPRDVLETLSAGSGIPADFLDDAVPLDVDAMRAFFERRVMGQPTAVEAACDVLTLVKAGLSDPGKPLGVLFFVGPTGVGKTELARAMAAYLFGSEDRLLRFDMSEYATYDAHERLLGTGSRDGLLTSAVRQQPFSVLLLDEIEKAHSNVFGLCLQMFDAGRLTDQRGRTASFRQTIVILTSNVGAEQAAAPSLGFGRDDDAGDRDAVMKEMGRVFRPEFLNRLDRVVYFRPLSTATARKIAEREVAAAAGRTGIARRKLVVDVDPAVISLLLRRGYSRAFGARPLKRTVERVVLQPLARAIATGAAGAGAMVRIHVRGDRVDAEVIAPDEPDGSCSAPAEVPGVAALAVRATQLANEGARLTGGSTGLSARKAALLAQTGEPGFWDDRVHSGQVLDEVHRLDHLLSALDTFTRRTNDTADQAAVMRVDRPAPKWLADRLGELGREGERLDFLLHCKDSRELGDAYVAVRLVSSQGQDLTGVRRIAGMLRGAAERRGLECEVLDDRDGGDPVEDAITLHVAGPGAFALLRGESGLHHLSRTWVQTGPGGRKQEDRDVVRVDVAAATAPALDVVDIEFEATALEAPGRLLARPDRDVRLVHTPSHTSIHCWARGSEADVRARLLPLLAAFVAAPKSPPDGETLVRRYVLGPSPLVRDRRTGLTTGRLDRVLAGEIEPFLVIAS